LALNFNFTGKEALSAFLGASKKFILIKTAYLLWQQMKHIQHYRRMKTNFIIVINEIKTFPSADFFPSRLADSFLPTNKSKIRENYEQ
jgi:hypothetical protein